MRRSTLVYEAIWAFSKLEFAPKHIIGETRVKSKSALKEIFID